MVTPIYTLLLSATMVPLATNEPETGGQNTFFITFLGENVRLQVGCRISWSVH